MLIEAGSALIDRVHDDRANGQLLGGEDNALQRVAQQHRAEPTTLVARVDGESRENRDRGGIVARHAFAGLLGGLPVVKLAGQQRVVADHRAGSSLDEGARRVTPLALPGVADKPAAQCLTSGLERRGVVAGGVVAPFGPLCRPELSE
jgi:hypothetical protein